MRALELRRDRAFVTCVCATPARVTFALRGGKIAHVCDELARAADEHLLERALVVVRHHHHRRAEVLRVGHHNLPDGLRVVAVADDVDAVLRRAEGRGGGCVRGCKFLVVGVWLGHSP